MTTILIVDSDTRYLDLMHAALTQVHVDVLATSTPKGAERYIDEHEVAGAIIELELPQPVGPRIVQRLRDARPDARAVIVSRRPGRDIIPAAFEVGAEFVLKPFDPAALLPYLTGEARAPEPFIDPTLRRLTALIARDAFVETGGNLARAARLLGLSRPTLRRYLGETE